MWNFGGTPGGTRTPNPLVRSQVLYPVELRAHMGLPIAHVIYFRIFAYELRAHIKS